MHLNQTLLDVQETLTRERRFSHDNCHSLLSGLKLVREGLDNLERDIRAYFEERDRSLSCVLGNSQPHTTLIDETGMEAPALEGKKGGREKG